MIILKLVHLHNKFYFLYQIIIVTSMLGCLLAFGGATVAT